jgi:hypothetical protein
MIKFMSATLCCGK